MNERRQRVLRTTNIKYNRLYLDYPVPLGKFAFNPLIYFKPRPCDVRNDLTKFTHAQSHLRPSLPGMFEKKPKQCRPLEDQLNSERPNRADYTKNEQNFQMI